MNGSAFRETIFRRQQQGARNEGSALLIIKEGRGLDRVKELGRNGLEGRNIKGGKKTQGRVAKSACFPFPQMLL